jgi:hypothetical protein
MKLITVYIFAGALIVFSLIIYTTWLWQNNVESAATAINGLITPTISFLSIYLLYITLTKQIESNDNQSKNLMLATVEKTKANLLSHLELLKDLFKSYTFFDGKENHQGTSAWEARLADYISDYENPNHKNTLLSPEIFLIYITKKLILNYISIVKNHEIKITDKNQLISYFILYFKLNYEDVFLQYMAIKLRLKLKEQNPLIEDMDKAINILLKITSHNFETFVEFKKEIEELVIYYNNQTNK